MDAKTLENINKHLGKPKPLIIDGDEFDLVQLGTDELPFFLDFYGVVMKMKGEDMTKAFANMKLEEKEAIVKIIDITLKKSFPDLEDEKRKQFGLKYMAELLGHIMIINSNVKEGDGRLEKARERIKKMQDAQ